MVFSVLSSPSIVVVQSAYQTYFQPEQEAPETLTGAEGASFLRAHGGESLVDDRATDWLKFRSLVEAWKVQRGVMSSVTESVLCPAYQTIIGMGATAIPFLLRQLSEEGQDPDQWFWALKAITGADPVNENDLGNNLLMARAWFEWGVQSGYAW